MAIGLGCQSADDSIAYLASILLEYWIIIFIQIIVC